MTAKKKTSVKKAVKSAPAKKTVAAKKTVKKAVAPKAAAPKKSVKPAEIPAAMPVAPVQAPVERPVEAAVAKKPNRALVGVILLAVFALVVFESVSIMRTKKDQQRMFTPQASFGMRGGDTNNRETYKGVLVMKMDVLGRLYLVDNTLGRVLVYDSMQRKYSLTVDKEQAGSEQFRPVDVDGDADGNIYVVDQESQTVKVFDASGKLLREWPTQSGDSICVEPEGTVLVTDKRRMQIVRYSKEGVEMKKIGDKGKGNGKFLNVFRMDVDDKGNIYALDLSKAAVLVFNKKGKFQKQWMLKFKPDTLTSLFVRDQKVYVNDFQGQIVWTYQAGGKLLWRIRAEWPIAPVMDAQENYYLPNKDGIGVFLLDSF